MFKRLWARIEAFFYTSVAVTEPQSKENTVKLALVSIITSMLANGVSANTVQITVTDDSGAALPNASLYLSADNGATVTPASGLTDSNGQLTANIISSTAGACTVTGELADTTSGSIQVYFVAVPATGVINPAPASDQIIGADGAYNHPLSTNVEIAPSPLATMKADFEKVVAFIEHGIEVLGKDAEADLVALKNKFLL